MNYSNISVTKYSTQTTVNCGSGKEYILRIEDRAVINPPPPRVVNDFIKYLLRYCVPIYSGKSMITFSDVRRDQLIDYMTNIGIKASRLFYMSAIITITSEDYAFFSSLDNVESSEYKRGIDWDIALIKSGILPPLAISTVTTS